MNELDKFDSALESGNKIKFLNYFQDKKNCEFVIKNNLFWKNIYIINCYFNKNVVKIIVEKLLNVNINFINPNNFIELININCDNSFCIQVLTYLKNNNINLNEYLDILANNNAPFEIIKFLVSDVCKNEDNIDNFVKNFSELINYIDLFKDDEKIYKKISDSINNHEYMFLENILVYSLTLNSKEIEEERIMPYFKRIVDEVLDYEGIKCSDIRLIGEGGSSCVYKIGNKVLKLGRNRLGFKIDNNKRFLRPLLRENIKSLKDGTLFFIEITEKVKTENITYEDVYQIYKELRDEGLVWVDCYSQNLGRLEKSNKIYFGEQINPVSSAINYNTESFDELEKRELVILDNELILPEKDFIDKFGFFDEENKTLYSYEKRYQKERNKKTINF